MTIPVVLAIYLALFAFIALLLARREWWLSQHLLSRWGPRTDTPCMTRAELLRAGAGFLRLAVLLFAATLLIHGIGGSGITSGTFVGNALAVLSFMGSIFTTMSVAAAAYLCVRGLFRSRRDVPPQWCSGCPLEWERLPDAPLAAATGDLPSPAPAPRPAES